jgi:hypothetical protein
MKHHVHVWQTIFGTAVISGRRYSRYRACVRHGCKAKRKP